MRCSSTGFNPRPAFQPGEAPPVPWRCFAAACFNPRPAFQPGEAWGSSCAGTTDGSVSIHARLFSRAKPRCIRAGDVGLLRFNPRPAFQPGEALPAKRRISLYTSFNPRPAFQPGEAWRVCSAMRREFSFNPRPAFQPGEALAYQNEDFVIPVSIHARLFSRAKRSTDWGGDTSLAPFQSTPGFSAGRSDAHGVQRGHGRLFQSTPGFSAGRSRGAMRQIRRQTPVSIHARLFSRAKRKPGSGKTYYAVFQSTPGFSAGRSFPPVCRVTGEYLFQSTPGFSAGRSTGREPWFNHLTAFQSTPGFSAGRSSGGCGLGD